MEILLIQYNEKKVKTFPMINKKLFLYLTHVIMIIKTEKYSHAKNQDHEV